MRPAKRRRRRADEHGHRPLAELAPPYKLQVPEHLLPTMPLLQAGTQLWGMGKMVNGLPEVRIFLSKPIADSKWHMTISRPDRYPHWDEVTKARYSLIPDEIMMAMLLPPAKDYISLHDYVFQLVEVKQL